MHYKAQTLIIVFFIQFLVFPQEKGNGSRLSELTYLYSVVHKDSLLKGEQFALDAFKEALKLNDLENSAKSSLYLGRVEIQKGDLDSAVTLLNKALEFSLQLNDLLLEAKCNAYLGETYFRKNNFEEAKEHLLISKKLLPVINDNYTRLHVHLNLASTYNRLGDRKNALDEAFEAEKNGSASASYLSNTYNLISIIYNDVGDQRKSVDYLIKSLKLSETIGDWKSTSKNLINLAGHFLDFGALEKSEQYFQKAIEIYKTHNDLHGMGYALMNFGGNYFRRGEFGKALNIYREALESFHKINDERYLAFTYNNIGEAYLNLDEYDSAFVNVNKALIYGKNSDNKIALGCSYHSLGKIAQQNKNYNDAIKNFELSLEREYIGTTEENYLQLANVYEILGENEKALKYIKLRTAIRDSIFNEETQKLVIDSGIKFETEATEKELDSAKSEKILLENKFNTSKNVTFFLVVFGFVLIGSVTFYYRNRTIGFIQKIGLISGQGDKRRLKKIVHLLEDQENSGNGKDRIDEKTKSELLQKLNKLMENEKLFTNPEMSLSEIAKILETNTSYISHIVNQEYNLNFSNYINRFRIQEAKRIIQTDLNHIYTFEGIAKDSGFKSKSAFNNAFKKFCGKTPSEFYAEFHS